jgi:hypothetical protein
VARKEIVTCDGCGAERKEANHWWSIAIKGYTLGVTPFTNSDILDGKRYDFCGEACVHKFIGEFLSK